MRLVVVLVLAGLVALPLRVSAQADEEGTRSEPTPQDPAPSTEPAPEEPVLELKLDDDAGVDVAPSSPRTVDGYALEQMELRVDRTPIGFYVSSASIGVGAIFALAAALGTVGTSTCFEPCPDPGWVDPLYYTGITLMSGGTAGLLATGILLGVRKRKLRQLEEEYYRTPRRVQWDLAQSRLVF